jgi:hypothetical protein
MIKKDLEKNGFVCTDPDTNQWVKKLSDTNFLVYDNDRIHDIELSEYSEDDLNQEVSGYYSNIYEVRRLYLQNANQIIAECVAENNS